MSNLEFHDEKQLLNQVSMGDEQAFRILFDRYHRRLGMHIYRITESFELAEEVVQDVFVKIWLNKETLAEVRNFGAYLFILSKNHALNYLKKLAREQLNKIEWGDHFNEILAIEDHEAANYYSLLDEAINQLPPQQQKIYLLSRHQRLKYVEIAEQLNLSKETVKKYLQLATQTITAYMQENVDLPVIILFLLTFF